MSPQSRATTNNTTFAKPVDNANVTAVSSGNICSGASSSRVADLASAADAAYALHKIESESGAATPANPLAQATVFGSDDNTQASSSPSADASSPSSRKRASPPAFLSSYGSAFLSGIFADIAQAAEDDNQPTQDRGSHEPQPKKARTAAATSFARQSKSLEGLSGLADGADDSQNEGGSSPMSLTVVVSPRLNTSAKQIHILNHDHVRALQDTAFPSLPQLPITVSSGSCSTASMNAGPASPRDDGASGDDAEMQDSTSYGWFVATEGDAAGEDVSRSRSSSTSSGFIPDVDLAFKPMTAPVAVGNQDLVVQQALAADTIDDVLGDLF